ncbi:MAG: hypothetical protein Q9166_005703 [cf. Caloplaca sp. 2 TL-2023]
MAEQPKKQIPDPLAAQNAVGDYIKAIIAERAGVEKDIEDARRREEKSASLVNRMQVEALDKFYAMSWKNSGQHLEQLFGTWFLNYWWPTKVVEYDVKDKEEDRKDDLADLGIFTFMKENWFAAKDYEIFPPLQPMVSLRRAQHASKEDPEEVKLFFQHLSKVIRQKLPTW